MVKCFLEWIKLKHKLHNVAKGPPLVSERELWWMSWGENIGSEINGKSDLFSRPGVILKKLSRGLFLAVPTTTQPKSGLWYAQIKHENKVMYACLHQIRVVDYRRLSSRLGQIDSNDFARIKEAFCRLYK